MSKPTVCAVMLVNGRPEMVARAIRSFRAQTYERKWLLLWDSTPELICCDQTEHDGVYHVPAADAGSIGALRNEANGFWNKYPIIAHWDSDDWSHPQRLTEQVELLARSGKECVGYNQMLFWRTTGELQFDPRFGNEGFGAVTEDDDSISVETGPLVECGEAWLYRLPFRGYALGTSLMYWRKAWERNPFEDTSNGEDKAFLGKVSCESGPAFTDFRGLAQVKQDPRMIATVHGANTATVIDPAHSEWKRVPEWDKRVSAIMEGA